MLLERSPASAASAPHILHAPTRPALAVDPQVARLNSVGLQLRGTASLLTQTLPNLSGVTALGTADTAASATRAAVLSQRLAAIAASRASTAAARTSATSTAAQLRAALAATQAKAAAAARLRVTLPIRFCNFTIQIGPIIINIPRLGIHIVIGPFFIHFRAPCFLSGRIPVRVP
jgi:hypothetical protein